MSQRERKRATINSNNWNTKVKKITTKQKYHQKTLAKIKNHNKTNKKPKQTTPPNKKQPKQINKTKK